MTVRSTPRTKDERDVRGFREEVRRTINSTLIPKINNTLIFVEKDPPDTVLTLSSYISTTWTSLDLTSYVADDTKIVLLGIRNDTATSSNVFKIRKPGSSYPQIGVPFSAYHPMNTLTIAPVIVGYNADADEKYTIEYAMENNTTAEDITVFLFGYFRLNV